MKFFNHLAKGMLVLAILVSCFALTAVFTGQKVEAYTAALATVMPGDLSILDLKLRGNDVLDSNGVTRITVGTTNTFTGINTFVGATGVTGAFGPYSRTEAELKALTPAVEGLVYYDSTNKALVISTGTAAGAFGIVYAGATAATGW
jgi:hypothetical protein